MRSPPRLSKVSSVAPLPSFISSSASSGVSLGPGIVVCSVEAWPSYSLNSVHCRCLRKHSWCNGRKASPGNSFPPLCPLWTPIPSCTTINLPVMYFSSSVYLIIYVSTLPKRLKAPRLSISFINWQMDFSFCKVQQHFVLPVITKKEKATDNQLVIIFCINCTH